MKSICLKHNKIVVYRIISILLLIAWMIVVFTLSNETSNVSTDRSNSFIGKIVKTIDKDIPEEKLLTITENITPVIRKLAHFTLYTVGGIIIYNVFDIYKCKIKYVKTFSVLSGAMYAVLDELHQLIVPGRSGELRDSMIDTLGIILGVFVCLLIFKIIRWKNGKRISKYNSSSV